MTCVLPTTPWHHFNDHLPWLPMGSDTASPHGPMEKSMSQGYVSAGSDTRKSSTSSTKKRASRAGTRSVTTLSAAQLERKRANDREAQRAIRQRTKDHIDHLERTVNELRGSQEQSEKIAHATQQRNRELEEEIVYLRNKLNEAGFSLNPLSAEGHRLPESGLLSVPSTSPVNAPGAPIPRPETASTPSSQSASTQGSGSRHGSWQHGAGFVSSAMGLPSASAVGNGPGLTAWRSHENGQHLQSVQTSGSGLQDPSTFPHGERVDWSGTPSSYQYVSQEQQRPQQQFETASSQQQHGYQPSSYHAQMTPQSEFTNIAVSSSPSSYQVQGGQTSFPAAQPFQVTPLQIPTSGTDYASPHAHMQPPPLPNSSFHSTASEPSYNQPQAPPSMQYRDESANRSYSLTHYPTA